MALPSRPSAVVTGGGSGLGRALCVALAARHARILVADVDEAGARETIARLHGVEAHFVSCDVSKPEAVERLADEAFTRFGGVDLLVNNAGVAVSGKVGEVPLADWQWIMGINLWGVIYGCHYFLPRMRQSGHGHILNVASAAGLLSAPNMGPYNVTKSAVVSLSETMYGDLSGEPVGVSVLCPTFFKTNIGKNSRNRDTSMGPVVEAMLEGGRIQADGVAQLALEGCDRGDLYITPHADGRAFWRVKRAAPHIFHELAPKVMAWQLARLREKANRG